MLFTCNDFMFSNFTPPAFPSSTYNPVLHEQL